MKNKILTFLKGNYGKTLIAFLIVLVTGYFYGTDKSVEVKEVLDSDTVKIVVSDTAINDTIIIDTVK